MVTRLRPAEAADDLVHHLGGGAGGGNDEARLPRGRQLQFGELAVEQGGGEEVTVPFRQPRGQVVAVNVQDHHAHRRAPLAQEIPVGALEGRAGDDAGRARRGLLIDP